MGGGLGWTTCEVRTRYVGCGGIRGWWDRSMGRIGVWWARCTGEGVV